MSNADPQVQAAASPEADHFAPVVAKEVLRRAVEIQDERALRIPLAEIKATLATLGIEEKTVDLAAAEVREELKAAATLRTPWQWLGELAGTFVISVPGVWMILAADPKDIGGLLMITGGVVWLLLMLAILLDKIQAWWAVRHTLT